MWYYVLVMSTLALFGLIYGLVIVHREFGRTLLVVAVCLPILMTVTLTLYFFW